MTYPHDLIILDDLIILVPLELGQSRHLGRVGRVEDITMRVRLEPGEQELYRSNLSSVSVSLFRSVPRIIIVTNRRVITYLDDNGTINDINYFSLRDITHLSRHESFNILGFEYWVTTNLEVFFVKTQQQRDALAVAIDRAIDQLP